MTDSASSRPHDLLVLGVSGFTGKLVLQYLNRLHLQNKLTNVRVAAGGRSLDAMRELCRVHAPDLAIELVEADVKNEESLFKAIGSARVCLTCVGPYELLGEPVVKGCVAMGTHYVDITGEEAWVKRMRATYDVAAKEKGVTLVPFAGHDCVPSDLVSWFALDQIPQEELQASHAVLWTGVKMDKAAGISNGTLKTMLGWAERDEWNSETKVAASLATGLAMPQNPSSFVSRIKEGVVYLKDVPAAHGGPLAGFTSTLLPDGYVVRTTNAKAAGALEVAFTLLAPNRPAAYVGQFGTWIGRYLLKLPGVIGFLQRSTETGGGPAKLMALDPKTSHEPKTDTVYSVFSVLRIYDMKAGINAAPLERIVARLDSDRDPYLVTAVASVQIALDLLEQHRDAPKAEIAGFQTPVGAVGGQKLMERCNECFRISLIARL